MLGLGGGQGGVCISQCLLQQLLAGFQFCTGVRGQQLHAIGLCLGACQGFAHVARPLEHGLRNLAVNLGAREFFQQLGAIAGVGIQKCGKAALCEQHGFGKTPKVQPGDLGDALDFVLGVAGQDVTFPGGGGDLGQFHLGWLQCAIGPVAGTALAPEGAVGSALHLEFHLRHAVAGVAGHQVVIFGT